MVMEAPTDNEEEGNESEDEGEDNLADTKEINTIAQKVVALLLPELRRIATRTCHQQQTEQD